MVNAVVAERGLARIDLLKADTEGYELEVVRGAAKSIEAGLIDFVYAEVGFEPDDAAHTPFGPLAGELSEYDYRLLGLYEVVHWPDPWRIGYCNALFTRS